MKKIKTKNEGFVLVIILVMLSLIGIEIYVLTASSNTIITQTNSAHLNAAQQNLIASGLAWSQKNDASEKVRLNFHHKNVYNTELTVTRQGNEVRITTSCNRGRHKIRHDKKYNI